MSMVTTNELGKSLGVTSQRIAALSKQLNISEEETIIKGRNKHYHPNAVRKILEYRGVDYGQREVMAYCNNKGGVGKTSLAVNTALRFSALGFKVLIVDADPQGNSTSHILSDYEYDRVLFDVVSGSAKIEDTVVKVSDYLSIIPSNLSNSRLDMQFATMQINHQHYFNKLLKDLDYNFIIWDLSPSISTTNFLALLSCSQVNIVTTLSDFSVQGLEMTNDVINQAKNNFEGYSPSVRAIINMFDSRMTSSLEHLSSIKETGVPVFDGVIRVDSTMTKSQTAKDALSAGSNVYKDIANLVDTLIGLDSVTETIQ